MIVDVNAYVGHWPFRPLPHRSADDLLRLMDAHGIDKAFVASVHGVFYKNAHAANRELAAEVEGRRDRLIPFATLNPAYIGWERDLRECVDALGMAGLRLYPVYHAYELKDACAVELGCAAAEQGLPIQLPVRLADLRQRHWMDVERNLGVDEIAAFSDRCPRATLMVLEAISARNSPLTAPDRKILIEMSRLSSVLQKTLPALVDAAGPKRVVFGTGMPFKYPKPALMKMELLDAAEEDKERIYWRNAMDALGRA